MSAAKHTPGPWSCFYKSKYDEWHVSVPMPQGSMRWALFDDGIRSENPEADARLIAAAPEQHELLATFTEWARQVAVREDVPRGIRYAAAQLADDGRRLLAKATGSAA